MVVLTHQRRFPKPFKVDIIETILKSTRVLRYLGVTMDEKLSFRENLENTCVKTGNIMFSLSSIMTNTMGPRTKIRKVLLEVVHSILLYETEVWVDILKQKTSGRRAIRVDGRPHDS
ncbi:uncharacterized protein LOC123266105 [Cotesia glomerata]|uniref:uncharacterized protein LOC123266105 n=1 Tax=Cotesia glomerata TaxID=32391 RepID=UPI001D0187F3|nr:uncharacterized protein LOC123266105 [Cotesia glomerata]